MSLSALNPQREHWGISLLCMKYSQLSRRPRMSPFPEYSQRFRSHHCFCQNCQGNSHQSSPSRCSHSLGDKSTAPMRNSRNSDNKPHSRVVLWASAARSEAPRALLHHSANPAHNKAHLCGQDSPSSPYKAHQGQIRTQALPSHVCLPLSVRAHSSLELLQCKKNSRKGKTRGGAGLSRGSCCSLPSSRHSHHLALSGQNQTPGRLVSTEEAGTGHTLLPKYRLAAQQRAGIWTTALMGTLGQHGCPEPRAVARGNPQTKPFPKPCRAKPSFLQPQLHLSGTNGHRGNARQQRQEGLHSCAQTAPETKAQQKQAPFPSHTTRPTQYILSS